VNVRTDVGPADEHDRKQGTDMIAVTQLVLLGKVFYIVLTVLSLC
jgi:hypothetical protein